MWDWLSNLFGDTPSSDVVSSGSGISDLAGGAGGDSFTDSVLTRADLPWYQNNPMIDSTGTPSASNYWNDSAAASVDRPWYQDNPVVDGTGSPSGTNSVPTGIMATLNSLSKSLDQPGAKLGMSAGMGLLSYLDAQKKNKMLQAAKNAQAQAVAEAKAQAAIYGSPLHLAATRSRLAVPTSSPSSGANWFASNKLPSYYAHGGGVSPLRNYIRGGASGQSDKIDAKVSPGEYFFDADVVSALGDGNNEAGAAKLDQMRENIRAHKRSAPASKIPPKAKSPLAYLKGAR